MTKWQKVLCYTAAAWGSCGLVEVTDMYEFLVAGAFLSIAGLLEIWHV